MKKIIALVLVLMLAISLTSCSISKMADKIVSEAASELSEEINSNVEIVENEDDEDKDKDEEEVVVNSDFKATIEETVICEKDGYKVTVKELSYDDSYYAFQLKLLIENGTKKSLTLSTDGSVYVNNCSVGSSIYEDVSAGKNANVTMNFYEEDLAEMGIEEIGTIKFAFSVYDEDYEDLVEKTVEIKTSEASKVKQTFVEGKTKLYEKDGVKVTMGEPVDDDYYGFRAPVYVENTSKKIVTVDFEETSINGFMADSAFCWISYCAPGTLNTYDFTISEDDFDNNDIDKLTELEFTVAVEDSENYDSLGSKTVTLKF